MPSEAAACLFSASVPFTVKIGKGGETAVFSCVAFGEDEVAVERVSFDDFRGMKEDQDPYEGPIFDELDENLQESFNLYLFERGINSHLAELVIGYSEFKENNEYKAWLQRMVAFTK
jgi:complement component 1 Q subcomponent-binding protein